MGKIASHIVKVFANRTTKVLHQDKLIPTDVQDLAKIIVAKKLFQESTKINFVTNKGKRK